MPSESRIQITVKLPPDLHGLLSQAITEHKYTNMTNAIITALEKELKEPARMSLDLPDTDIEVQRLTKELQKNVSDLRVLQTTFEGLQRLTEEKDRSIERLENDLAKAGHREEDLKTTYNNYFVQVQSLINQKAIEAPGNKKQWWKFW